MSMSFHEFPPQGDAPRAITAEDILALRRTVWQNGLIDGNEAEAILALNAGLAEAPPEWTDFFVEALSVWLVDQQDPRGYIDEAEADWLAARLGQGSAAAAFAERALLVRVLEKATSAPERLRQFALTQIERAVLVGEAQPHICADEARLLRRLLFSAGGDRPAGVSQTEAELLFRLKEETLHADNAPEWKQLFVQGVANYLQATPSAQPLTRERGRELERFMAAPSGRLGGFIGRMARTAPNGLVSARRDVLGFGRKQPSRDWDAEFERAVAIDSNEQTWLDKQVHADDAVDDYEQALLDFLAEG